MGLSTILTTLGTYSYSYDFGDTEITGSSSLDAAEAGGVAAVILGLMGVILIPTLIFVVLSIIANWKVFTKMGMPGWYSLIPFFSDWKKFEAAGMQPWFALVILIPVIGSIAYLIATIFISIRLARGFGKSDAYAIGIILLQPIFLMILGFGKADWDASRLAGAPNIFPPEGSNVAAGANNGAAKSEEASKDDSWVAGNDSNAA